MHPDTRVALLTVVSSDDNNLMGVDFTHKIKQYFHGKSDLTQF